MATRKKSAPEPALGEYLVDLKQLGATPLAKIVGNVGKPILLGVLQDRIWNYLQKNHTLVPHIEKPVRALKKRARKAPRK